MKIFIGNVDDRTTQDELSALFEKYGTVVSCAVMKQYAFVHMRGTDNAMKAIEELNGRELHGKKMVVELSKPRPSNTCKIFVGNVSTACDVSELRKMFEAYGRVVECDVVKDYAFVHMEKETDAREAIKKLNGKELKGKRINVELSNKTQKPMSANGSSHGYRSRRSHDPREPPQGRPDPYDRRRATEAAYASYALKSPYERHAESARYGSYENRPRPPSPMYYSRDRSPMRRSPSRQSYTAADASAVLASAYRSQGGLASAYGNQNAAALASAYGSQPAAAYGGQPNAYGCQPNAYGSQTAAYGSQTAAYGSQPNAYGSQTAAYGSQPNAYGSQTAAYGSQSNAYGSQNAAYVTPSTPYGSDQASYGNQGSSYGAQGSALSAYGTQMPSLGSSISGQTSSNIYASQPSSTTPYAAASAALASAYRQQQSSGCEAQFSNLGQPPAMSNMPPGMAGATVYERTRLSPPSGALTDNYTKTPDNLKRFASDRHFSEMSDYRRLAESEASYRRSPPKSQMEYQRPLDSFTNYPQYSSDYLRTAQLPSGYQRRL
ncbi:RNA-binding protein 14-like [Spea bombifrons]|uniref:RNA-binding protein 14-like n=1 Tax=Spea bombifrons TaxID=233779 RepID=UPI00234B376C|nr:RNA-binding protein 14-like [Spea bombifrons]